MTDSPINDPDGSLQRTERAFRVIPGDPESRVILHVPHSSRIIHEDVRVDILLDDVELEHELDAMTDAFTDVIAERAAELSGLRPWIFVNDMSRLVVDPERFPDESEEMNAVGMGAVYTRTSTGAVLREDGEYDESGLFQTYFDAYAAAFTELVDQRLQAAGEVTILDIHSFPRDPLPYELHGDGPRPEICLGTDTFHTPPGLVASAHEAFSAFKVGQDSPFEGCYVPLTHYGEDARVHGLMIEVRRDLYMDDTFELVEPALTPIVTALVTLLATEEHA